MSALSSNDQILKLQAEYPKTEHFYENGLSVASPSHINIDSFFGSSSVLFLRANTDIHCEAPVCIAAPLVTLVAKKAIHLGEKGRGTHAQPGRLFASKQFCLVSPHIILGDFIFLGLPKAASIACKKLTLIRSKEETKSQAKEEAFEVVKSWVMDDATEIEVVKQ